MASGSPAELIPFTRFLERRQQLHRIAVANGTVGDRVKGHVGRQVEVVGITCDTNLNDSDAFNFGHRLFDA